MSTPVEVDIPGGTLEVLELAGDPDRPAIVMLHEGLGSVGLWRGFPERLHAETGARTIAFSRFGHGRSSPPPRSRTPTFMHEEAREVVPALLAALDIRQPILVGHSDGASIALIHAAEFPVTGVAVLAPHVFVEEICVAAIAQTTETFENGGLRDRMARHHNDPSMTFYGWAGVWLDPEFRTWSLESHLKDIAAPVLAIQGRDDEYGTLAQIDSVERNVAGEATRLIVEGGHSPHLAQPQLVLGTIAGFIRSLSVRAA